MGFRYIIRRMRAIPLFALLLAATGVGIAPRTREDETQPGS